MKDGSIGSLLWAPLAVLLMYSAAASGFARPLARVSGGKLEEDPLCTAKWNYGHCVPLYSKCGAGYRLAVRSGDLCRVLTQLVPCKAPCVEAHGEVHVGATHFDRAKRGPNKEGRQRENPGRAQLPGGSGGQRAGPAPAALSAAEADAAAEAGAAGEVDYGAHTEGSVYALDGCTYRVGGWQACSVVSLSRHREDRLLAEPAAAASRCSERKIVTMDCSLREVNSRPEINRTGDCRYSYGKWSKCDEASNTRARHQQLLSGAASCAPEVEIRKPCFDRSGRGGLHGHRA